MAKLATLAVIFSAFLLMSRVVETHWTTITSVEIEEEGPREVGAAVSGSRGKISTAASSCSGTLPAEAEGAARGSEWSRQRT
ncbi:hypothetical protein NL676_024290 [Syzygium grande]|nr:hypothetical protein NL676_024290 [Syzygium grande]